MRKIDCCAICGGSIARDHSALVTPFLAHRIWNRKPFSVPLVECSDCGFVFFNPRLEPSEEMLLYSGYREREYQQSRGYFEPWYTEKLNASLSSPESWAFRKSHLKEAIPGLPELNREFESVLDFGGDRGDLIADLVRAKKRFVFEISGVEPVSVVRPLRTLEECGRERFDLIITSNVLEHVGSPQEIIAQIASISSPGTFVFNEVPYESATGVQTRMKRLAQEAILAVVKPRLAMSLLRPGVLTLMHEHVNYFSPQSLRRLMEVSGFEVLAGGAYSQGNSPLSPKVAWNLARASH